MSIKFATGFNSTGSYAVLPTQPTTVSPLMLYGVRRYGLSRVRASDGLYTELLYPRIPTANFNALNTFFGFASITGTETVDGTFYLKMDDGTFANFNGTIAYVSVGERTHRTLASWSDVAYVISGLVKI